jgi:hypothetical protein
MAFLEEEETTTKLKTRNSFAADYEIRYPYIV